MTPTWCQVTIVDGANVVPAVLNLGASRCQGGAKGLGPSGASGAGGLIPPHAREARSADQISEQKGAPK